MKMKVLLFLFGLLTGLLFSQVVEPVSAQSPIVPGLDASFKTSDGWTLDAKYMPAQKDERTVLLLHGRGQSKEHWILLARYLKTAGLGYLAVDLRGHGDSLSGPQGNESWRKFRDTKRENDFEDMRFDIDAATQYLKTQGVAISSIAIVGDEVGGSLALKYAAVHPEIPMVVLISPGLNYEEVLTVNAMRAYKNRPVLLIYAESDRKSSHEAPLLYQFARLSAGDQNASLISIPNLNGRKIAFYRPIAQQIADWIKNPVKIVPPPAVSTSTATSTMISTQTSSVALSTGPAIVNP